MRNYLAWALCCSVGWWLLLLPVEYALFSSVLQPLRESVYEGVRILAGPLKFESDSVGMYLLLPVSCVLGALSALLFQLPFLQRFRGNGLETLHIIARYFLVLELWEYGWAKLTKMQFYLPEPNTLYTPLGDLPKDLAYWFVMGSSHTYVVFMGIAELLAGTLLVFRRTRFVGLLLATGIFVNVLLVNISFDISVKLFACTLLALCCGLLTTYPNQWRALFQLPVRPLPVAALPDEPWKRWLRAAVLALFVVETVYPSVMTGSLNDDTAERPPFHGAYAVTNSPQLKRLYVHRQGYLILENAAGQQRDWKITRQTVRSMQLLDERTGAQSRLTFREQPQLCVYWQQNGQTDTLILSRLPYREKPLIQPSFHWFSDDFH